MVETANTDVPIVETHSEQKELASSEGKDAILIEEVDVVLTESMLTMRC